MWTPRPSRRIVSPAPATLLLRLLLLAGAANAAPPLVGVSPQDEAYFATQVIACRDGSGSFPRSRLNDGYCDCADGTDEPACPEGKFYCRNIGDTPRLLFSSFVNDKICDCCDGSDEYESGIHCQNTCRNIKYIAEAADGGSDLSVTHLDANTNEFMGKHAIAMEDHIQNNNSKDLVQKIRGLRMALVFELGLLVCIFAFCIARRRTRTRRRQHILKRDAWKHRSFGEKLIRLYLMETLLV
ncbi:uncharacterized protein LOC8075585 isoform X3 [Sorghum bicolor]|uniref:uncharacterized protein LOC8075585 isoform X3 n=1 Tax=Sorghum bicolor TaxID=4558 RepID=UPI000B425482|nr:uncharacterized protein LOC8075585 isoform X3 [Sorghum bicolor]|eukprot:XP_021312083.1 uncharacterized protein LOC8075585 isoform X3 [Sorghum bicolor]